mmetsp:Transcript_107637/g.197688  ORF Transcript_107637/g.197688 Transcript_107637/m.197688 type:complete len:342 (+) Transcript_107637:80-1105(+)
MKQSYVCAILLHTSTLGLATSIGSSDGICAGDQCDINNNSTSGATMLQVSTKQHVHTAATQTPREYKSLGFGQCSFEDGTYKSSYWTKSNCPQGPANCATLTPCTVDECKADCDSQPSECGAIAFFQGHCWVFRPGFVPGTSTTLYYTKTTADFTYYECFAVAEPTTTTTTTTTTVTTTTACVPYTEDTCRQAAVALGLQPGGNGVDFAGDYSLKGCYSYASGSYKGYAFYGTGGSEAENRADASEPKIRVPGYDCRACQAYTEEACLRAAIKQGLYIGGKGYNFADNHPTAGCYAYSSGDYAGYCYYGTGGQKIISGPAPPEASAPVDAPKYRPQGYDCA